MFLSDTLCPPSQSLSVLTEQLELQASKVHLTAYYNNVFSRPAPKSLAGVEDDVPLFLFYSLSAVFIFMASSVARPVVRRRLMHIPCFAEPPKVHSGELPVGVRCVCCRTACRFLIVMHIMGNYDLSDAFSQAVVSHSS